MELLLTEICDYLNNYFWDERLQDEFAIESGVIDDVSSLRLKEGQYIRIQGSTFNDGVWQWSEGGIPDLTDESFDGYVYRMAIPAVILDTAEQIGKWQEKYGVTSPAYSPFSSESFGNYSYSKGGSTSGTGSTASGTWQSVFGNSLAPFRRPRGLRP